MRTVCHGVFVGGVALVPVVGDALVAGGVDEVVIGAGDGHEGLEDGLVEDAFGGFGGFVGHEAVDEGEGGLGDFDAGEGKVWIVSVVGVMGVDGSGTYRRRRGSC